MEPRTKIFFASDVHLGLRTSDPAEREDRFVRWLKSVPRDATKALYLLGDIWDFWYEYRDVIPREGIRVIAQLIDLVDAGVEVYFVPGNHDIWCYSFFEQIGIRKCEQPIEFEFGGKVFCAGHGDRLGGADRSYLLLQKIFHCKFLQALFSALHPWIAFRFGLGWSCSNRRGHVPYSFRGAEEPLYKWADERLSCGRVDYFIFGHFHDGVDMEMREGSRLIVLDDWMSGDMPHVEFDAAEGSVAVF